MKLLCLFILTFALTFCRFKEYKEEYKYEINDYDNASYWLNDLIKTKNDMFMDIEEFSYTIIHDKQKDEYIKLLSDKEYYILNNETFFLLTGQTLKRKYGLAIRGVFSHSGGNFNISRNIENEYVVIYIVGGITVSYNKTVLIIETDKLPVKVYICLGGGGA